jgi:hypothetical protein
MIMVDLAGSIIDGTGADGAAKVLANQQEPKSFTRYVARVTALVSGPLAVVLDITRPAHPLASRSCSPAAILTAWFV